MRMCLCSRCLCVGSHASYSPLYIYINMYLVYIILNFNQQTRVTHVINARTQSVYCCIMLCAICSDLSVEKWHQLIFLGTMRLPRPAQPVSYPCGSSFGGAEPQKGNNNVHIILFYFIVRA